MDGATTADVDLASLAVNGVPPDRVTYVDTMTLQLKIPRGELIGTLPDPPRFAQPVSVSLTGQWRDGGSFTAADTIRVIRPRR